MSISQAATEIRSIRPSAEQRRQSWFRMRQRALDALIEEMEQLVMHQAHEVPEPLRRRAEHVLNSVHGKSPRWLDDIDAPTSLLDHLFVAEGRLRQQYYLGLDIDFEDSA